MTFKFDPLPTRTFGMSLALSVSAGIANAEIIGQGGFFILGSLMPSGSSAFLEVDMTSATSPADGPATFSTTITDGVSGAEFILDSGPEFDLAVEQLANGINDFVTNTVTIIPDQSGAQMPEHVFSVLETGYLFFSGSAGANGIDFEGATIESIMLRITHVELTPQPVPAGVFTQVDATWDLFIMGTIPTPSAASLLGLAAIAAMRRRR